MSETITYEQTKQIQHEILRLLSKRAATSSICPSDAARSLGATEKQWRELMPQVRQVAYEMAVRGEIEVTQRGVVVRADEARGAIRLRLVRKATDELRPDPTPPTSNS
jgi:Protein of unknown function (DUF3253)